MIFFSLVLIIVFTAGNFIAADRQGLTVFGLTSASSYHFSGKSINTQEKLPAAGSAVSVKKPGGTTLPGDRIVGYYASWAAYSGFTPDKIDASKLTNVNYAFADIGKDLKITMGAPDTDPSNFRLLNALKEKHPGLRTSISIGGWSGSGRFSDAALTEVSRTVFAESCVAFMKKYGFDGVDIDWEYPVGGGLSGNVGRSEDKHNFTLLLQKLREKLDEQAATDHKHYLLTIAAGAGDSFLNNIELSKIQNYLDYVLLMTYDFHGTWDPYTDLVAPLYDNTDVSKQYKSSTDSVIKEWDAASFPMDKLIMGVPFYGYKYTSANSSGRGLYSSYSSAASVNYDKIVKNYLNKNGYTRYFHSQSKVPWLYNGSTFISYEDPESIGFKTDYIKSKKLGGAMIWELSQDSDGVLLDALYEGLK
jgi:chitinase